jgi:single-strand DNA-binding protein
LANAAYALQPHEGVPLALRARFRAAVVGLDRDSSIAPPPNEGEDKMPFPSPTNSATLIGKLTRDPDLRTVSTSAGKRSVLTLGIAVRKAIRPEDDAPTADFFDVTVWGALAETCAVNLSKGRLVGVSARLEPTAWEASDGSRRRGMELVAGAIEFLDRQKSDSRERESEDVVISA